jgi:predicted  nucleic acid-binding Zn-ribbon protein
VADNTTRAAACADCGAALGTADEPARPCPECGSERLAYLVAIHAEVKLNATAGWTARSSNDARTRLGALREAAADIEASVEASHVSKTQDATKRALEAIHELQDCHSERQEWSQAGWNSNDLGLWTGLIGARNTAHHKTSHIVALSSGGNTDDRLKWDIEESAIAELRFPIQRQEYEVRVAGQPVLPQLRSVLALVEAVLP